MDRTSLRNTTEGSNNKQQQQQQQQRAATASSNSNSDSDSNSNRRTSCVACETAVQLVRPPQCPNRCSSPRPVSSVPRPCCHPGQDWAMTRSMPANGHPIRSSERRPHPRHSHPHPHVHPHVHVTMTNRSASPFHAVACTCAADGGLQTRRSSKWRRAAVPGFHRRHGVWRVSFRSHALSLTHPTGPAWTLVHATPHMHTHSRPNRQMRGCQQHCVRYVYVCISTNTLASYHDLWPPQ